MPTATSPPTKNAAEFCFMTDRRRSDSFTLQI
jgi:hypothetical protein